MSIFAGKTLMITGGTGSFGNAVLNRFLRTDIAEIRIFSRDEKKLAEMYGVETKVLNQAVKRNIKRFPDDFMFQLTKDEFDDLRLRSQFVTSNIDDNLKSQYAISSVSTQCLSL